MKLIISGREYEWPTTPTFRQRKQAARALDMTVDEFVQVIVENRAENTEAFAALALVMADDPNPGRVMDMTADDISLRVEDGDLQDTTGDQLPPASSRDDATDAAAA